MSGKTVRRRQSGFGYLLVLLMVVLLGLGLGVAGTLWRTDSQRVKENELLFNGEQYRKALTSYYNEDVPGGAKHYPKKLEDLLLDKRKPELTRHLRKLYPDPVAGKNEWGLIRDPLSQEVSGVYSLASGQPLKQQGFSAQQKTFAAAVSYEAWRFEAIKAAPPPSATPAPAGIPPPPGIAPQTGTVRSSPDVNATPPVRR